MQLPSERKMRPNLGLAYTLVLADMKGPRAQKPAVLPVMQTRYLTCANSGSNRFLALPRFLTPVASLRFVAAPT